jgi:hypothetical protein
MALYGLMAPGTTEVQGRVAGPRQVSRHLERVASAPGRPGLLARIGNPATSAGKSLVSRYLFGGDSADPHNLIEEG